MAGPAAKRSKDPGRFLATMKHALVACSAEVHTYGACVAAKVPGVEKGACEREFTALRECARAAMAAKGVASEEMERGAFAHPRETPTAQLRSDVDAVEQQAFGVYLAESPLRFSLPGASGVMYDEALSMLLVASNNRLYAWPYPATDPAPSPATPFLAPNSAADAGAPDKSLSGAVPGAGPEPAGPLQGVGRVSPQVCGIPPGNIMGLRFSLDARILAVQRGPRELEMLLFAPPGAPAPPSLAPAAAPAGPRSAPLPPASGSAEGARGEGVSAGSTGPAGASSLGAMPMASSTRRAHVYSCQKANERILGFFWTDCALCNLVVVTTSGLEMYLVTASANGELVMVLTESRASVIAWYSYAADSRIVVTASGAQFRNLSGLQFCNTGLVRIPPFEAIVSAPGGAGPAASAASIVRQVLGPKVALSPQDLRIVTLYNMVLCLQIDRPGLQLHIFHFFRDAVVLQAKVALLSVHVSISVVDNLLLLHHTDRGRLLVLDPLASTWEPLLPALPLGCQVLDSAGVGASTDRGAGDGGSGLGAANAGLGRSGAGAVLGASSVSGADLSPHLSEARGVAEQQRPAIAPAQYKADWVFLHPSLVLDKRQEALWRLKIDLLALASLLPTDLQRLSFLQRRSCNPCLVHVLSSEAFERMLLAQRPVSDVANALDILMACHAATPASLQAAAGALSTVDLAPQSQLKADPGARAGPGGTAQSPGDPLNPGNSRSGVQDRAGHSFHDPAETQRAASVGTGVAPASDGARAGVSEGDALPPALAQASLGEQDEGEHGGQLPGPGLGGDLHAMLWARGLGQVALCFQQAGSRRSYSAEVSPVDVLESLAWVACRCLPQLPSLAASSNGARSPGLPLRFGEEACAYLACIVLELLRSCHSVGVPVPRPATDILLCSLVAGSSQWTLLLHLLRTRVLAPSFALALHVILVCGLSNCAEDASAKLGRRRALQEGLRILKSSSVRTVAGGPALTLSQQHQKQQELARALLEQGAVLGALQCAAGLLFEPSMAPWSFEFLSLACQKASVWDLAAIARILMDRHLEKKDNVPLKVLARSLSSRDKVQTN